MKRLSGMKVDEVGVCGGHEIAVKPLILNHLPECPQLLS